MYDYLNVNQSLIIQNEWLGNIIILQTFFQELNDIRQSGLKSFRDIQVDESNILTWQGLIVPVSMLVPLYYFYKQAIGKPL